MIYQHELLSMGSHRWVPGTYNSVPQSFKQMGPYCQQHQYVEFRKIILREEFKALHELYGSVQTN